MPQWSVSARNRLSEDSCVSEQCPVVSPTTVPAVLWTVMSTVHKKPDKYCNRFQSSALGSGSWSVSYLAVGLTESLSRCDWQGGVFSLVSSPTHLIAVGSLSSRFGVTCEL